MAALTADKLRETQGAPQAGHGLAGVGIFYVGALLMNISGDIVAAADTAAGNLLGVCPKYLNNTDDGGIVEFEHGHVERFAFSGTVTAAMLGELVFVVDNQTVGLAADVTNNVPVGTIERFETGHVWVAIRRGYTATSAA